MKKLFLFLAASTLALASCSSDDDSPAPIVSPLSVSVDGVVINFKNVVVNENIQFQGTPQEFILLEVVATNESNTSQKIKFGLRKNLLGTDALFYLKYLINNSEYDSLGVDESNITINSENKISGTFSGNLTNISGNGPDETILTNGTFNISY